MENMGMNKQAPIAPKPMRAGEMLETIERQQVELSDMTDEIRARLVGYDRTEGAEPSPMPQGYIDRLDVIRECNRKVLTILEKILEIL